MRKLILFFIATLFITSCNRAPTTINQNTILGNWYTLEKKKINNHIEATITYKEQFFKNNTLLSTKWFNFKDRAGNNLGEYYITKLFTYKRDKNYIEAKFIRCSVGITSPLKYNNLGYKELYQKCQKMPKSYRVTKKAYRLLNNTLYLGNRVYYRE